MRIDSNMPLTDLAERMGNDATPVEARYMRRILIEQGHSGRDTLDISELEWLTCLEAAIRFSAKDRQPDYTPPKLYPGHLG
jgi:hypothetical protein